ncbi:MAG: adenylosuccinate synthetase [Candidatus Shapirobacteria bacterium]|nr:adenylosuccinate synthetase [Candidatus Shapirobacteria bacterium]
MEKIRENSYAYCGGQYGDEGKGKEVDQKVTEKCLAGKKVIVYRDNGGANAGHTVELENGDRLVMHLLPSGVLNEEATVVLGKEMVIHPSDLIHEIDNIREGNHSKLAKIMVDEMAILSLDTHRAFEDIQKKRTGGGNGSTGRGIGPTYADVVYRHPLRMRDLINFDEAKLRNHYQYYKDTIRGLVNTELENIEVVYGRNEKREVGNEDSFIEQLKKESAMLKPFVSDVYDFIKESWNDESKVFIFEKAQSIGLDSRWGVYPDVTASNTCFDGIYSSTYGIVNPNEIKVRSAVVKATYMSSVGSRKLPTVMEKYLAEKIRVDAYEFGSTTGRPRDIAYIDMPTMRFFANVGNINDLTVTHMDIVYPETPIKVCNEYYIGNKVVDYRPEQEFLLKVKPHYIELPTWDKEAIRRATIYSEIPQTAKEYIQYMEDELKARVSTITTGPKRDQTIEVPKVV